MSDKKLRFIETVAKVFVEQECFDEIDGNAKKVLSAKAAEAAESYYDYRQALKNKGTEDIDDEVFALGKTVGILEKDCIEKLKPKMTSEAFNLVVFQNGANTTIKCMLQDQYTNIFEVDEPGQSYGL
mgnify:CR=1 FL=1